MNEDKIELWGRFTTIPDNDTHLLLDVTVKINGTAVKWSHVDVYSIARYWINHKHKKFPQWQHSSFEPFTCSCGVAGCAGIWDGIYVRARKHSVEWRAKKEDGYGFLPKTFFSFDRKQYEKALRNFMHWLRMEVDYDYHLCVDMGHFDGDEIRVDQFFAHLEKEGIY